MTNRNNRPVGEFILQLEAIVNNLQYIKTEAALLNIEESRKSLLAPIIENFLRDLLDARNLIFIVGKQCGVEMSVAVETLNQNTLIENIADIKQIFTVNISEIIKYTNTLAEEYDKGTLHGDTSGFFILMTESVGNILRIEAEAQDTLNTITL